MSTASATGIDTRAPLHPSYPRFRRLLEKIAAGASERDRTLTLPHEQIRWLADAGVTRLRLPQADGGGGLSLPEVFKLVIDLAAADSNVAHILRVHFAFLELVLHNPDPVQRQRWVERINAGAIVGNAISEQNGRTIGLDDPSTITTALVPDDDGGYRLNGEKFYSTGTLFATWVRVLGITPDNARAFITLPTNRDGVELHDDWDGFGQSLTGTGTSSFHNVRVETDEVELIPDGEDPPTYQGAHFQLYLQALSAGILAAVRDDAVALVRGRARNFSHAAEPIPRQDPQVLQVVGEIAADAEAAEAIVLHAAAVLQQASDSVRDGLPDPDAAQAAQLASAKAKVAVDRFSYATAARLFDAGGASATQAAKNLDRHWRNLRTISTHNPTFLKASAIGDHLANGTRPPSNGYF
ncbi:MAG: acyl-CoA dehydrogenase family protein [Solirubrobacterales bacterium]|nr:acyl-CoA dehydrogenase family protein [Solirubrobacterales bacterium]